MKATNILLDTKLEAKIADFGLSKTFNRDNEAHISTNTLVGTPGYVDPEYVSIALFAKDIFLHFSPLVMSISCNPNFQVSGNNAADNQERRL